MAPRAIRILQTDTETTVVPAADPGESRGSPIGLALGQILRCGIGPDSASAAQAGRPIVIVGPGSRKTWLRDMLRNLDASEGTVPYYVLYKIENDPRDDTYAGLASLLMESHIATEVDLSSRSPLVDLLQAVASAPEASKEPLSEVLDRALPGGIEALLELALRPSRDLHHLVSFRRDSLFREAGALSVAFGACLAGEFPADAFARICQPTEGMPPLTEEQRRELGSLVRFASEVGAMRSALGLAPEHLAPLSHYLKDRNVIVVEDRLQTDRWDRLLPSLFGGPGLDPLPKCARLQELGWVRWSHFETLDQLLAWTPDGDAQLKERIPNLNALLSKCDVLLVDLASSGGRHPEGIVSPMFREALSTLTNLLTEIRCRCDPESSSLFPDRDPPASRHRRPIPVVIVFSESQSGMTTRTLLHDIRASDFFYKTPSGPIHQRLHYYTLRQAIIRSLEERAAWIAYAEPGLFKRWMGNFLANERPTILRAMEGYHHYSSMSLVNLAKSVIDRQNWLGVNSEPRLIKPRWIVPFGRVNKSGPTVAAVFAKALDVAIRASKTKIEITAKSDLPFHGFEAVFPDLMNPKLDPNLRPKVITFVDDFVGSGGQLEATLSRFVGEAREQGLDLGGIVIEVYFLVGLDTPSLRRLLSGNVAVPVRARETYTIGVSAELFDQYGGWPPVKCMEQTVAEECGESVSVSVTIEEVVPQVASDLEEFVSILKRYPFITSKRHFELSCQFEPLGWKGEQGGLGLVSTFANVPGNTLPIVWGENGLNRWVPLRQRFFNPFDQGKVETEPRCLALEGKCPLDLKLSDKYLSEAPAPPRLELRSKNKRMCVEKYEEYRNACYAKLACRRKSEEQDV